MNIKLIVYDFDGVMTDNKVYLDEDGKEMVVCNRSDGLAVSLIKKINIYQIILSSEKNKVVTKRAEKIGLECFHGISNKLNSIKEIINDKKVEASEVAYIGNDINDYEAMNFCGLKVCPADAHELIKNIADLITSAKGGEGVIREFYDFLQSKREV